MRSSALILTAIAALLLAAGVVLALGLDDAMARMVVSLQRDYQNALGRVLRALRAGQPGAVSSFLGICFAYGFFHALGPGHGKAVIAAYGFVSRSAMRRMIGIAALSSLGQATVAVALIYAGVWLYDGARDRVEGLAARIDPIAMLLIAGLGLMMFLRGLRRLSARRQTGGHDHLHDAHCDCGHAHAPDPVAVSAVQSWRELAALVLGIALRPCTGALFLLILTWRLGIDTLGIFGAFVMGFGTLMVTGCAAVLAVAMRNGVGLSLSGFKGAAQLAAIIEFVVGALIFVLGLTAASRLF